MRADDRPRWARIVHIGVALELATLIGGTAWRWTINDLATAALWFPLLCGAALLGVLRHVAWGRFLFSVVSVLLALAAFAIFVPDLDDPFRRTRPLDLWLARLPSLLSWAIVVATATVPLLPAVAIGWRKHWFRSAAW